MKTKVVNFGLYAKHNQNCSIFFKEKAVFDCQKNVFEPSWEAQRQGWKLIQSKTLWQKFCMWMHGD